MPPNPFAFKPPQPMGTPTNGWRGPRPAPAPRPQATGSLPFTMPGAHGLNAKQTDAPPPGPTYGSESGPGILEQWFNQRATGSDPAFEYMSKRGMTDLGNRYAASGGFNSGAARQGESDFMANLVSQRMGALDSLAGGASGEHRGRVNDFWNHGMGLAGGESGLAGAYDLKSADALNSGSMAAIMMMLNKAGVNGKASQSFLDNLFGGIGAGAKIFG